jgi:hypothetical protein
MRLYLDDDSIHTVLIRLLQRAGHDVERPQDVGLAGDADPVHLTHSIASQRVLLSGNHDDFADLHDLILEAGGKHTCILIVRRDDDRRRDLKPQGIVAAIEKLVATYASLENEFVILNHWR